MGQTINGIDAATLARIVTTVEKRMSTNGARPPMSPASSQNTPPVQSTNGEPREHPAKTISCGDVVTRIWANKTQFGEIVWRIDQRRTRTDGVGGPSGRSPSFLILWTSSWEIIHSLLRPRPLARFSARIRPRRHHSRTVNSAFPSRVATSEVE